VTPPGSDPSADGSDLVGGAFSGGVAPGYSIDPLRGSRLDSTEDVRGAQKAGKKLSGPLGLNCSTERSNSSTFWRAEPSVAKNLLLVATAGDAAKLASSTAS